MDERVAIYLGGPHHGKTCPVRGTTRVALQVGPEGDKRVAYELAVLMHSTSDLRWFRTYVYRLKLPDGKLEPAEQHVDLLDSHAREHGIEFLYPSV